MSAHRIRIDDIAFGGRGVGRLEDGRVVFVPFVIEGEVVRVEIVRERRKFVEARLLAVEEPSPHRVSAPCPYFGRCGGCSYQHIEEAEQLRLKQRQVEQAIRRIGRCESAVIGPVLASPKAYAYRNRITVHFDEQETGFFRQGGRDIVDIERCLIAEPEVNDELTAFREAVHPANGHRTLRTDTSRRTFRQTNDSAAAVLLQLVSSLVGTGGKCLIDAYCGAGFFGKALRGRFEEVVGLEWDRWAVAEAEREAAPNERYLCGDVAQHLARELSSHLPGETLVICDPPEEGLSEDVRGILRRYIPMEITYVSCNPATLARDLNALEPAYVLESVQPLDMFPQTAQIEVVAFLRCKANLL